VLGELSRRGIVMDPAWFKPHFEFRFHPTIGVHGPLHFDLYDRWNERSIAGATYHVVHAGGRAAFERPVNAAAAEGRRIARFNAFGHTQGSFRPQAARVNPDFPMTLDLRWIQ
jgi:uncharacterized protein (DUF2126 family)